MRESVDDAVRIINSNEQQYGGVWFDRGDVFLMHIAVLNQEARDAIEPLVPPNVPVAYHTVPYSLAQLRAAMEAINANWGSRTDTEIDVKTNSVIVTFHNQDDPVARAAIETAFAGMVTFAVAPVAPPL